MGSRRGVLDGTVPEHIKNDLVANGGGDGSLGSSSSSTSTSTSTSMRSGSDR